MKLQVGDIVVVKETYSAKSKHGKLGVVVSTDDVTAFGWYGVRLTGDDNRMLPWLFDDHELLKVQF